MLIRISQGLIPIYCLKDERLQDKTIRKVELEIRNKETLTEI